MKLKKEKPLFNSVDELFDFVCLQQERMHAKQAYGMRAEDSILDVESAELCGQSNRWLADIAIEASYQLKMLKTPRRRNRFDADDEKVI